MTQAEFEKWKAENGTGESEFYYCNDITWVFAPMGDGWIAVFKYNGGEYEPEIQVANLNHAKNYCNLIEPVPYGVNVI